MGECFKRSKLALIARCQALLDLVLFDRPHTGQEIGSWLYDVHKRSGCEPYMQGSQTVDGDATAGASIGELCWKSTDERSELVVADKCDAHQANTSGRRASGTSVHNVNYNPTMGVSLNKLHVTLGRVSNSGKRMGIYKNVGKERKRTKTLLLDSACVTRWSCECCCDCSCLCNYTHCSFQLSIFHNMNSPPRRNKAYEYESS